ncbi:MAG: betaine--homocysteine S-methyltransferase [Acidimicrobiia bacterium]|nr:betaine--homocysteine S-methyltransferase [Acidimicrobiia bacterium]
MSSSNPAANTSPDRLLSETGILVADGGMGTSLFALGMPPGACPELLNVECPEMVIEAHSGFLDAGCDIVLTNTFGANRRRLALHGLQDRVAELNMAAAALLRRLAGRLGRPVVVAGSVGPTGDLLAPLGPLEHGAAVDVFAEQIDALVRGGVDVVWIETMSSREELEAAYEAALLFQTPVVATMSFDTHGRTMMGFRPEQLAAWSRAQAVLPAAVGANCGVGAGDVVLAVSELADADPGTAIVAKANCGLPAYTEGHLAYPHGPEMMPTYVDLAIRAGARLIGACCGSRPGHIAAIREAVDCTRSTRGVTREEIARRLPHAPRPSRPSTVRRERRRAART